MANDLSFRSASFERDSIDEEKRTVSLSVSSDQPVDMGRGELEILDHSPDSVDLSRLRNGSPLLFNHSRDQHLGRILEAHTDGHKLRVTAKISRAGLGAEKWEDIRDGILQEASLGYRIDRRSIKEEGKIDGVRAYRVMKWSPLEGSLVSMPADQSVGIGRSEPDLSQVDNSKTQEPTRTIMAETAVSTETKENKIDVSVVAEREQAAVAQYKERCKKIFDWVAAQKKPEWRTVAHEVALKHTADEANFDSFRAEALNKFEEAKPLDLDPHIDMSRKEKKRFSFCRLFSDLKSGRTKSFEIEACSAARERLSKLGDETVANRDGLTIPEDVLDGSFAEDKGISSREFDNVLRDISSLKVRTGLVASTQNVGGYLVGVDLMTGSIIELLRNKALVSQMGITNLSGLVNNVAIPRVLTGATVYWLPEAGSVTATNETFGQLTLSPHRMGADVYFTKQLVAQASLSVEAFVRDDLTRQMAVELDRVYINGTGTGGEPQGVLNTTGVGTVTFSGAANWDKILTFEKDVAAANADLGPMAFLTTPTTRYKLKQAAKIGSTFPNFIWEGGNNPGTVNGYDAYVTNNVPGNKVLFGVWSEFIAARWAGIDVIVDPYSLKKTEQIEITTHQYVDCGIRHPAAFDVSTDSGAQ